MNPMILANGISLCDLSITCDDTIDPNYIMLQPETTDCFALSDHGISYNTSIANCSYVKCQNFNEGTWGEQLDTNYYYQNTPLPFINKTSMPTFYFSNNNTIRNFPTQSTQYGHTQICCITHDQKLDTTNKVTIKYNTSTSELIIKNGENILVQKKTFPYILLDIQACGGDGSEGYSGPMDLLLQYPVAGGGGGGSGGFFSCSIKLNTQDVVIERTSAQYTLKHDSLSNHVINIGCGGKGDINYGANALGRGAGGRVSQTEGTLTSLPKKLSDNIYALAAINGSDGVAGAEEFRDVALNWQPSGASKYITTPATHSHNNKSIILSSTGATKKLPNLPGGLAAQSAHSDDEAHMGGGGGASSIMSQGGTYVNGYSESATPGIGAGGFGGLGWLNWVDLITILQGQTPGQRGGCGCIWIYYVIKEVEKQYAEPFYFIQQPDNNSYHVGYHADVNTTRVVEIPSVYNGKIVSGIAENGFKNSKITTIVLPSTIQRISKNAFANSKLENIFFGKDMNYNENPWREYAITISDGNSILKNAKQYFYQGKTSQSEIWVYNENGQPIKLKHNWITTKTTPATCTSRGLRIETCTLHSNETREIILPITDHAANWIYNEDNGTWQSQCGGCGEVILSNYHRVTYNGNTEYYANGDPYSCDYSVPGLVYPEPTIYRTVNGVTTSVGKGYSYTYSTTVYEDLDISFSYSN